MEHLKSEERGKLRGIKPGEKLRSIGCVSFKYFLPNSVTSNVQVASMEDHLKICRLAPNMTASVLLGA
jgi:hypothetical protein